MYSHNSSIYTKDQLAKIGNAIIFLCERMQPLSKTKLLKLIYLIEELSVKKYGMPFFNIRFDVWKLGPVSKDIYAEITTSEPDLLGDYIVKETRDGNIFLRAKQEFADDEFSDIELQLLEDIAGAYRKYTAEQLIQLTHRKHSPWYSTASKYGLLEHFNNGTANTSNIEIDLSSLIRDDEQKLALYKSHKDFLDHSKRLKF
jgi:uncharacterized phage-associated protein